jgi:hypothetical protein
MCGKIGAREKIRANRGGIKLTQLFSSVSSSNRPQTQNVLMVKSEEGYSMRFISTRLHGLMDYLMALILIASPWLFEFAAGGAETWIPVGLGVAMLVMAACTDYEFGLYKRIGVVTHLTIDAIAGLVLAASPWLFGFSDYVWTPFVVLGLLELMAALTTHTSPSDARRHAGRPAIG